jgi:hypothetical protein
MDHQTIQAIATEVARQLPSYPWIVLIIQVGLTILAAAVAAFWGANFKEAGKQRAIKAHFDEILRQFGEKTILAETIKTAVAQSVLKANTEIVEKIKLNIAQSVLEANTKLVANIQSEIAQRDWAVRERISVRRGKLDELLAKVNECRAYLERHTRAAYAGEELPADDPLIDLEKIAIYFPELSQEVKAFSEMHWRLVFEGEKLPFKLANASTKDETSKRKSDYANLAARTRRDAEEISAALTVAASTLLKKIMDAQAASAASAAPIAAEPQSASTGAAQTP